MASSSEQWPADWYPVPHDPTQVRYWDGHRWTEHVAVRDPSPARDVGTDAPPADERMPTPARGVAGPPPAGPTARPTVRRSTPVAVALLTTPVLGYFLPFFGPAASAVAAFLAVGRAGPVLWTGGGWPHGRRAAATVGFAALWLLPLLNFLTNVGLFGTPEGQYAVGTASWIFLPLGGPQDHWTPAAVALVAYAIGAALSAWRRRPWPWLVGGVAATLAYDLTIAVAGIPFIA